MRRRGEADLVVDDDVHGPAGAVAREPRKPEALRHHALAREGRVAVQEHRQDLGAVVVAHLRLLGADLAEHHGVHRLEVRGVRGERQVHGVAVEVAVRGRAEVILDVARALHVLGLEGAALELIEDGAVGLLHHVGEHAEPPAVGHPDDDVAHAQRAAALDDLLHRGDQAFPPVEPEALGAGVLDAEELLEPLGLHELVEDRAPALAGEADLLAVALDPLLEPTGLLGVGDVHELQREGAAIGALHQAEDLAQAGELQPQDVVDEDGPVHVVGREAVGRGVELRVRRLPAHPERVEVGREVAPDAVGADQHQRADGVGDGAPQLRVADGAAGGLRLGGDLLACGTGLRRPALRGPLARERGGDLVARLRRPVRARPGGAVRLRLGGGGLGAQLAEEGRPGFVHRAWIRGVARLEPLDVVGVRPVQERGGTEDVGGLLGHGMGPGRGAGAGATELCH